MNFFSFLKPNKDKILQIKENTPQEIRKVQSEKQKIIYNTKQDWLRIQNFNNDGLEVIYYLQVSDKSKHTPFIKKVFIKDIKY